MYYMEEADVWFTGEHFVAANSRKEAANNVL